MPDKQIKITFPDGREADYISGITGYEIAEQISPALAKVSLAIDLNGKVCDIHLPINEDSSLSITISATDDDDDSLIFSATIDPDIDIYPADNNCCKEL